VRKRVVSPAPLKQINNKKRDTGVKKPSDAFLSASHADS
jgi:hypothetical protein